MPELSLADEIEEAGNEAVEIENDDSIYNDIYGPGPEWFFKAAARVRDLEAFAEAAREALREAADLFDATREGNYTPDSFTRQPCDRALALYDKIGGEDA